ncbi:MAG TPA: hypothetical protein VGJ05_15300 [Fimbriiglobus sp.]|jgi:hypothetical protein
MVRRFVVGWFFAAFASAGCSEPDTIATYKVPPLAPVPDSVKNAVTEYRVLGAIIPDGKGQSWFFLMQGKADDLAPHAEAFDKFLKGLQFPDGLDKPPAWTLPKGWAEDRTKNVNAVMPRTATFYPNGDDHGVEISLTRFGGELLTNVNRWRGKVGRPGVDEADLPTAAPAFSVGTGQTGYKVDVIGKKDPTASGGMPGMMARPGG